MTDHVILARIIKIILVVYFWVVEAKMFKSDGFTRLTRLTRNRILSHPRFLFFPDILRNRL